ncbi:NADH-quinone oxidoreductase subunit NuoE [Castellaniella caeni]|uniref:NADH-quinone oxidoreductase subunit NuoE n=1 Tax=Castellaniella caeni TaxID=266123 RepID=UPI00082CD7C7|nr:NADH-quinone oxidoreductase subunit NuoE [Castellaniella caeni]
MLLSEQAYRDIDREIAKYPPEQKQSAVMAALTIAQTEQGWVSPEIIRDVAAYLDMPAIAVQEVATFYAMYNTHKVGKYTLTICTNLPCALQGSTQAADYLKQKLGIDFHETTPDGLFTLLEGECMGACGDAPVIIANDKHMCCRMQPEKIDALIQELKESA